MGVLKIDKDQIWDSSKSLLHEVLDSVMINTSDNGLIMNIDLAIKQNIGYYDISEASPAETKEFKNAAEWLLLQWSTSQSQNSILGAPLGCLKISNISWIKKYSVEQNWQLLDW